MKDKKYPDIHLVIYRDIKKKALNGRWITYDSIKEIMDRRLLRFVSRIRYETIKELEAMELIKLIEPHRYEVIGKDADKHLNKYFCILD